MKLIKLDTLTDFFFLFLFFSLVAFRNGERDTRRSLLKLFVAWEKNRCLSAQSNLFKLFLYFGKLRSCAALCAPYFTAKLLFGKQNEMFRLKILAYSGTNRIVRPRWRITTQKCGDFLFVYFSFLFLFGWINWQHPRAKSFFLIGISSIRYSNRRLNSTQNKKQKSLIVVSQPLRRSVAYKAPFFPFFLTWNRSILFVRFIRRSATMVFVICLIVMFKWLGIIVRPLRKPSSNHSHSSQCLHLSHQF